MKTSALIFLLGLGLLACQQEQEPESMLLQGTYQVTRMTQYKDGVKLIDGDLPYQLADSVTLTSRVGLSVDKLGGGYKVLIILSQQQKSPHLSKTVGNNIGGQTITLEKDTGQAYRFFKDGNTLIGTGNGNDLTIDTEDKVETGHTIRNVLVAKKIIDRQLVF